MRPTVSGQAQIPDYPLMKFRLKMHIRDNSTARCGISSQIWRASNFFISQVKPQTPQYSASVRKRSFKSICCNLGCESFSSQCVRSIVSLIPSCTLSFLREVAKWTVWSCNVSFQKLPELYLRYIIRKLHTLVEKDYVILYFHTGADDDNYPQISWMTNFFRLLNHRYLNVWKLNVPKP